METFITWLLLLSRDSGVRSDTCDEDCDARVQDIN